ncbi:hypothetical protein CS022_08745 [Veronia nyctiphanis]|uniref:Uncharacterized protein n=1 Tax=Veronia nyctiphanis TaxID=1278244 RepID=A0A4Q0YQZ2_9GAMM|nr:hypothetical protein CS022_08745 [Veronia nyctiphanis]
MHSEIFSYFSRKENKVKALVVMNSYDTFVNLISDNICSQKLSKKKLRQAELFLASLRYWRN